MKISIKFKNREGKANYQKGHLIDNQFQAENSNEIKENIIPVLEIYNNSFKNYLVNESDAFVEIPLYTPNPPKIKCSHRYYQPIPVGIIFIQIVENKIKDIYYFPNNDFDYDKLAEKISFRSGEKGKAMTPYFKLKECYHSFFYPALISNLENNSGRLNQLKREKKFLDLMNDIFPKDNKQEQIVSQLSDCVLNNKNIDPFLFLTQNPIFEDLPCESFVAPFNALEEFIIYYGIKNALKSEVVQLRSRLIFLNVIIDFLENDSSLLSFIDDFDEQFSLTLDELEKIVPTMIPEELISLAKIYQRLSDFSKIPFLTIGSKSFDITGLAISYEKFISILEMAMSKIIQSKQYLTAFNRKPSLFAESYLKLVRQAEKGMSDMQEHGYYEEYDKGLEFIESFKEICSSF